MWYICPGSNSYKTLSRTAILQNIYYHLGIYKIERTPNVKVLL